MRTFQANENLTADGIVGPITWGALLNTTAPTKEINSIYQAAKRGQVPGLPYVSGKTNISSIENSWGTPTAENAAGAGIYDTSFSGHHAAFGVNKGGQLFDVRSYAANLRPITANDVEQVLGMPGSVHYYAGQSILMYPAGPNYHRHF